MNPIQKGITTLLRCAITAEKLPLPQGFTLADAMEDIHRHSLYPLAYAGAVSCGLDQSSPEMQELFKKYIVAMGRSERQMLDIHRICTAFEEAGIDYMPLKGCNMKPLYPRPELRTMGDADILIRLEQYDRIRPIMERLGFAEGVESDHELVWHSKNLMVELHKRLIPSYNKDFYAWFGDGWKLAQCREGCRLSMRPEDEMIYLFTHFAKHYRDGGIGCRHVVDLWVFLRSHPEMDEAAVKNALTQLQLGEFYTNMRACMDLWFADGAADERSEYITGFIFSSGNWGDTDAHLLSAAVKKTKHLPVSGRTQYMWERLFPDKLVMTRFYPVLEKAPWLLPACYLVRMVRKAFDRRALRRTGSGLKSLDQTRVEQRQELLRYVGLDYNF